MQLYFTRHGKTEWNDNRRLQGVQDSPLLKESFREIELLGQHLKNVPFEAVITSPLKRAYVTAKGVLENSNYDYLLVRDERLAELSYGELEGMTFEETNALYPEEMRHLRFLPHLYNPTPFLGEPYEDMLERSTQVVKEAIKTYKKGPLLFVGHSATLTGCIQTLLGVPLEDVRKQGGLGNNSLTILTYKDNQYSLDKWNDMTFLKD